MKSWVFAAALATMLVPASALAAGMGTDTVCEKQVHQAQDALQAAIRRHGEHSAQAEHARLVLERVEARCEHP